MTYIFQDLRHKTLVELQEIAKGLEHEAVQGYTQMNKDRLLKGLCTALGIAMHEHHEVRGIEKTGIKAKIRALKKERDQALAVRDPKQLKAVRLQIKALKKTLRKAMR